MQIAKHFELLGKRVSDKVTHFTGVASSISFDLYGCIQAVVTPPIDKDGKVEESRWFDVNRLSVLDDEPVMERPNFQFGSVADAKHGPAEKPTSDRF